jgi:ATP-binding cassette subfamily G (WHITE) protein 5 (sterolin 1)
VVATLSIQKAGLLRMFLRLFLAPLFFFFLWIFYRDMQLYQHTFVTRTGLILNCLSGAYFLGILNSIFLCKLSYHFTAIEIVTSVLDPVFRTRYFQESQEGLYGGTLFLITYNLVSIPFSFISMAAAGAIIYP